MLNSPLAPTVIIGALCKTLCAHYQVVTQSVTSGLAAQKVATRNKVNFLKVDF